MTYNVTGQGKALANSQLVQDKAYFEVKVIKPGNIGIGVSKNNKQHLNEGVGQDSDSWGVLFSANEGPSVYKVKAGTIISCLFDQSDFPTVVHFLKDEVALDGAKVSGMKGPVVPAVSVENGAEIEVIFDSQLLENTVPPGFSPIIFSQNFMF
jgi:SPRY domain